MNKPNFFVRSLHSHKKTILLIAITAAATLIVSSLISTWLDDISNLKMSSIGTIRFEGVEGYFDKNLANKAGAEAPYNWGMIWPGATRSLTLYLRISATLTQSSTRQKQTGHSMIQVMK